MATDTTTEAPTVTFRGRLVADPILRQTNTTGKSVSNIRVAVNDGDHPVQYRRVVVWGRTAEAVCEFLRKGHAVEVTGREQTRCYEPAEGDPREVTEIVARRVQFLRRLEVNQGVS